MRVLSIGVALTLCVACSSGTEPARGAAQFTILSGNNQTAAVAAAQLGAPVKGQLYRRADGSVAFRVFDALLPAKAYAQTVVQGGIPGATVCWADVADHPRLIPFSQCTNTLSDGTVAFNLHPDTLAGDAQGEVHWDSAGVPKVTATVSATITAGPAGPKFCLVGGIHASPYAVGDTLATDAYGNRVPARLVGDSVITVSGDTLTWDAARFTRGGDLFVSGKSYTDSLTLTDTLGVTIGHMQYIVGGGTGTLSWTSYGLGIMTNAANQAPNCIGRQVI